METHLKLAGRPEAVQHAALAEIIGSNPVLMKVLDELRQGALPDGWVVAGAIYNPVWNRLTGRPDLNGINDVDVFYFDGADLSYWAEDAVIQRLARRLVHLPLPVQVRNQARVHLWFPQKFGIPFTPLASSLEMLGRYASKTHAVAAQLGPDGVLRFHALLGLDDIFSFRVTPNPVPANRAAHEAKAARAKAAWPELTVLPWDDC